MAWLQTTLPFGKDYTGIQEALHACLLAEAAQGRAMARLGLFVRRDDAFTKNFLLLSPEAARFAPLLPGQWEETDPTPYAWGGLYTANADVRDFGLRIG